MPRRSRYDPLAVADAPRWLTILTLCREPLSTREIPAGVDLHKVMEQSQADMRAKGWEPETDGAWGHYFARRGTERVGVELHSLAPGKLPYGPSTIGTLPGFEAHSIQ